MIQSDLIRSNTSHSRQFLHDLNARAWALRITDITTAHALSEQVCDLAGPPEAPFSRLDLADSLRTLSHCAERRSKYRTAIEHAQAALHHYRILEDQPGQATALYLLASSCWSVGDYSQALAYANESVASAERAAAHAPQAKALNILGLIFQSTLDPQAALRYFQASLVINRRLGEQHGQADNLFNLGQIYLTLGDTTAALVVAVESLQIHQAIPYLHDLGMALALIGQIHMQRGEPEAARPALEDGLAAAEAHRNTYGMVLCLLYLGQLNLQEGQHDQAQAMLLRALALAEHLNVRDEQRECHEWLALSYEQTGALSQALMHYRAFHTLTEALRNHATMHQLKNLELTHQVALATQEREFYRHKHAELSREVTERRRVEVELQQRLVELSLLHRITQLTMQQTDQAALLHQITQELLSFDDALAIHIALFDHAQATATLVAASAAPPHTHPNIGVIWAIPAVPAFTHLLISKAPLTVSAAQVPTLLGILHAGLPAIPLLPMQLFPLAMRDELIGVLIVTMDRPTPQVSMWESLAKHIAVGVEHVRLFTAERQNRAAAELASRAKSRFLAIMSHEIRTPLTGILGYTELGLIDPTAPPHLAEYLRLIDRAGRHQLAILNDLLDLARIEANQLELNEQAVHLPTLLRECIEVFATKAQQKGITLQLVPRDPVTAGLPPTIRVDARRLRQVLLNLIGNALKFTDVGSIQCCVEELPSGERAGAAGALQRRLRFTVQDTGIGINACDLARIMQPFQQSGDIARQSSGSGLGLTICAELVRTMGGELQVQSAIGVGSTFWFDLPLSTGNESYEHGIEEFID